MKLRRYLIYSILFLLLSPFLVLLVKFPLATNLDPQEFLWALKNTVYQAGLSALVALFLGTWAAFGLMKLPRSFRKYGEIVCLAPNFLPPLFSLLVVLYWVQPYPVGILGIAFVHAVMNFGLVAVGLAHLIESRLGGMAELAWLEGSSRFQFLKKVYRPLMQQEYLTWFLFVFSVCFSSFSVPLIVGGQRGTTLEVLIYEKIRLSLEWGDAVLISLAQFAILGAVSYILLRESRGVTGPRRPIQWLGSWSGVALLVFFGIFYFVGYLDGVWTGFAAWAQFKEFKAPIFASLYGTFFVAMVTGLFTVCFFAVTAFIYESSVLSRFMRAYVAPSTTLAGFAILVTGPNEGLISMMKIPLGLLILFIGPLYRMSWEAELKQLRGQVETARILGADPVSIFTEVVWPQAKGRAFLLAGLAAAWACGDFALSRILAYKDMTLALITETLLSTYRLNLANLLSFGILVSSVLCFIFFWSWGYVGRRKSS